MIGAQFAGRVGLFLRVDDFDAARQRMLDHGVEFVTTSDEDYGRVVVFVDVAGNRWDCWAHDVDSRTVRPAGCGREVERHRAPAERPTGLSGGSLSARSRGLCPATADRPGDEVVSARLDACV